MFHVEAWDVNCPQHIPPKIDAAAVQAMREGLERRIRALTGENDALRALLRDKEARARP